MQKLGFVLMKIHEKRHLAISRKPDKPTGLSSGLRGIARVPLRNRIKNLSVTDKAKMPFVTALPTLSLQAIIGLAVANATIQNGFKEQENPSTQNASKSPKLRVRNVSSPYIPIQATSVQPHPCVAEDTSSMREEIRSVREDVRSVHEELRYLCEDIRSLQKQIRSFQEAIPSAQERTPSAPPVTLTVNLSMTFPPKGHIQMTSATSTPNVASPVERQAQVDQGKSNNKERHSANSRPRRRQRNKGRHNKNQVSNKKDSSSPQAETPSRSKSPAGLKAMSPENVISALSFQQRLDHGKEHGNGQLSLSLVDELKDIKSQAQPQVRRRDRAALPDAKQSINSLDSKRHIMVRKEKKNVANTLQFGTFTFGDSKFPVLEGLT